MAYKKLFKELYEQYTKKYMRKPKGLELIKIKLKAGELQREANKLIEFPRNKIQPLDPDDALPNYNETPGAYSRRKTPGSIEYLREEMKIAYRNEFNRLSGDETAEELTDMLKNLDTDGVPFAGGGVVKKIIKSLTMKNKDPMDSMKELNEVLKRKNELKLTDNEVDEIMDAGNDWIFQRDPDNLFIPDKTTPKSFFDNTVNDEIKQGVDDIMRDTSPAALQKSIEVDDLMLKYPGMNVKLATQIANDTNPKRKSDVIAMVEQTLEMGSRGMGGDEIIEIFKKTPRTKQAGGGLLKKVIKDYQKYLKIRKERPSKKRFKELPFRKFFEIYGPENFADGGQATSTGINYLLGEDDTNSRVPYAAGGRRGFLKLLAGLGAAGAAFKTGLMSLKGAAKPAAKIAAEEITKSGAPPHFFKLVAKIKALGDDAPRLAVKDKEIVTTYSSGKPGYSKDYTLTEDVVTGEQTIQRTQMDDALKYDASEYYGRPLQEEVYMSYKPGKGQADEMTKGKTIPDEYEEGTAHLRSDGMNAGEVVEESAGISDEIFEEVGEAVPEVIRKGQAGGGITTKLIKKLNAIDPGSTKRGKLSKPMSKKAKDKKDLREAIEKFSKRNRGR